MSIPKNLFRAPEWLGKLLRKHETKPQPALPGEPTLQRQIVGSLNQRVPDNMYLFEFFIALTVDGVEHIGQPKQAIRDTGHVPPLLRWGTRANLSITQFPWVDDPINGVLKRPRNEPADWLGAKGKIGTKERVGIKGQIGDKEFIFEFVFEEILQVGQNEVVFSLFNPEVGIRIAYGFPLRIFRSEPS
jgi:hypothetical protein